MGQGFHYRILWRRKPWAPILDIIAVDNSTYKAMIATGVMSNYGDQNTNVIFHNHIFRG